LKSPFAVGDRAVYPVHGVAEVVALENRDLGGKQISVYILKIMDSGMKLMVPTANAITVGLREVISAKETKDVFAILKSRDVPRDTQTWNRRQREYLEKIKTGSAFEIAEVLRDLCVLRQTKELSFGERRMLDAARVLIVRELAIAKNVTEAKINAEIDAIFTVAQA
jgi:CarD family transcriptional regulator